MHENLKNTFCNYNGVGRESSASPDTDQLLHLLELHLPGYVRSESHLIRLKWIRLKWIRLKWIELDSIELDSIELDSIELDWIEMDTI